MGVSLEDIDKMVFDFGEEVNPLSKVSGQTFREKLSSNLDVGGQEESSSWSGTKVDFRV
jgi:hypothetical protein